MKHEAKTGRTRTGRVVVLAILAWIAAAGAPAQAMSPWTAIDLMTTAADGFLVEYDCTTDSYADCCMKCIGGWCIDGQPTGGYTCTIVANENPLRKAGCIAPSSNCHQAI